MSTPNKRKELTEMERAFLDHLFSPEARGDYRKALRLAGYTDATRPSEIMKRLRDEIVEASMNYLALNAPRAALELTGLLDNPVASGATTQLKVVQQILDRVGVSAPKDGDVNLKVPSGGLFIMPAKEASNNTEVEDDNGED